MAQDDHRNAGAASLGELIHGLGVNVRVLVIGAHPDDEDTGLITWLARGRQVETAYLSLTRGDGGQNLIGNELGEALGVIRTEELLAARRIDGGHQYFTRAFDFGFSKSAEETYKHWPKDSILRDVVAVVRDFRPHIIVAVFSGTPRDGHGHHTVSGLLAREAFDIAGDSVRMPRAATQGEAPWTSLKFYRRSRGGDDAASPVIRFDVGEYSPLRGRSYAEMAAESRSQHKSQAMGAVQRKGASMDALRLEASRVGMPATSETERSIFDRIDSSWSRVAADVNVSLRRDADAIPAALAAVERAYDPMAPEKMLPALDTVRQIATRAQREAGSDAAASLEVLLARVNRATLLASGIGIDANVDHETWAAEEPIRPSVTVYNRVLPMLEMDVKYSSGSSNGEPAPRRIARAGSVTFADTIRRTALTEPWWLERPRLGDIFGVPIIARPEDEIQSISATVYGQVMPGMTTSVVQPLVYRYADPIKGEIQRPIAVVPAISVTVDQPVQYVPAGRSFDRAIRVELRSASNHARTVRVSLELPKGLTADSASRTIGLPDYAGNFGSEGEPQGLSRRVAGSSPIRSVEFRVRGTLPEGRHTIAAVAESDGKKYTTGYTLIDYDHIRPQRLYRDATIGLSAVDVKTATGLNVAYVPGVGDNVAPMLQQLGIPVTIVEPDRVAFTDLSRFTTVVVGTRAYESSPALVASNPRLLDFARRGGTLVVQYGQFEMANPGIMPYPVVLARPGDRVTEEDAEVRVTDPSSPILNTPNKIGPRDWAGWVQERALYMPRSHDERYRSMLSMNDTGEQPNDGAILVAPVGKGTYVYTTLSLFRQLPAGIPGGARLVANLLSADQRAAGAPQPAPRP